MGIRKTNSSYSHVLKYTGLFGAVQGMIILMSLVRNKAIAVMIGPAGMGLTSLYTSVLNFINCSTSLGIPFSAVKHLSELERTRDAGEMERFVKVVRSWGLLTALLAMLVCVVAGNFISSLFSDNSSGDYNFTLLAPIAAMTVVTGCETAILKATHNLKSLATIQMWSTFGALVTSIPIYFFYGIDGIIAVMMLTALLTLALTVDRSRRIFPLRLNGAGGIFGEGLDMVKLGIAFTSAGFLGSGAEMLIRIYLNDVAELETVGLYNAGFMLTITYAGMLFSSLENDYYPRLAAINDDTDQVNATVNRQMEVTMLLSAPLFFALMVALPILVTQLFSSEFLAIVPMAQAATLSMYIKSMTLPTAYITLAKGKSKVYMVQETIYYVCFVAFVIVGFNHWGLLGTGFALTFAYAVEWICVFGYAYWKYGFRLSDDMMRYIAIQTPLGMATYISTATLTGWQYWAAGCMTVLLSALYTTNILRQKSGLWNALKNKWKRHRKHN